METGEYEITNHIQGDSSLAVPKLPTKSVIRTNIQTTGLEPLISVVAGLGKDCRTVEFHFEIVQLLKKWMNVTSRDFASE